MSNNDLISRQWCLDEYDKRHVGAPGGARKIMEEAPAVDVPDMSALIDWLNECIKNEHTSAIEKAVLTSVRCKVEEIIEQAYASCDNCSNYTKSCEGEVGTCPDYEPYYKLPEPDVSADIYVGRWIPCSERLPDNDDTVLITHSQGVSKAWWNGRFWTNGMTKKIKTVLAWSPMPFPYTPKEEA